jgi:hypothetical protein
VFEIRLDFGAATDIRYQKTEIRKQEKASRSFGGLQVLSKPVDDAFLHVDAMLGFLEAVWLAWI